MNIPQELGYAKTHEWAKKESNSVRAGITDYAQHEISDVVYVELPDIGRKVEAGKECAVVESVKAAFDIYAPVSGKIVAVNEKLKEQPELVNKDPYGEGFFFVIDASSADEFDKLLSAEDYKKHLETAKDSH